MDVRDGIYGIAVGDAYGVPYEFKEKSEILFSGEHKMVGYGSHMQPIGTWSDDTSLTLCLLDNLDKEIDYEKIMKSFVCYPFFLCFKTVQNICSNYQHHRV